MRGVGFMSLTQGIDTTTPLGRLVFGQLALFAEFEREQIRERTRAGMEAARRRGKHIGRPRKLNAEQIAFARRHVADGSRTVAALADTFRVSPLTLARAIRAG